MESGRGWLVGMIISERGQGWCFPPAVVKTPAGQGLTSQSSVCVVNSWTYTLCFSCHSLFSLHKRATS